MASRLESLDTNILLRILLNDVPKQRKQAIEFITGSASVDFYVSDVAILEAVHVMETEPYNFPRNQITDFLSTFLLNSCIRYNKALIDQTLGLYLSHKSLSFNDCYLNYEAARYSRDPLWTYDKKLASQADNAKLLS